MLPEQQLAFLSFPSQFLLFFQTFSAFLKHNIPPPPHTTLLPLKRKEREEKRCRQQEIAHTHQVNQLFASAPTLSFFLLSGASILFYISSCISASNIVLLGFVKQITMLLSPLLFTTQSLLPASSHPHCLCCFLPRALAVHPEASWQYPVLCALYCLSSCPLHVFSRGLSPSYLVFKSDNTCICKSSTSLKFSTKLHIHTYFQLQDNAPQVLTKQDKKPPNRVAYCMPHITKLRLRYFQLPPKWDLKPVNQESPDGTS